MNNIENNNENITKNIYKISETEGLWYSARDNMGTGETKIEGYMGNFGFLHKVIEEKQPDIDIIKCLYEMESKFLVDRLGFALGARNVITDFLTYMFKNDAKYNPNYNNSSAINIFNSSDKSDYEKSVFNTTIFANDEKSSDQKGIKHHNTLDKLNKSLRKKYGGVNQYGVYLFQKCIQGNKGIYEIPEDYIISPEAQKIIDLFDIKHIGNYTFHEEYNKKEWKNDTQRKIVNLYLLCNEVHRFVSEDIHGNTEKKKPSNLDLTVADYKPYQITDENYKFYYKLLYYFMQLVCDTVYKDIMTDFKKNGDIFRKCIIKKSDGGVYAPYHSFPTVIKQGIPLPALNSGREYYVTIGGENSGEICILSDLKSTDDRLSSVLKDIKKGKIQLSNFLLPETSVKLNDDNTTTKQIYRIPGYPIKLGSQTKDEEKVNMFKDICMSVESLHQKKYVFRNIREDSFVACIVEDVCLLVYWNPKTIKNSNTDGLTVIKTVANKKDHYMAPKVRDDIQRFEEKFGNPLTEENLDQYIAFILGSEPKAGEEFEYWKKADLYALGMLGVKLFTNKTYESISKTTIQEIKKDIPEECFGKIEEYLTKYDNEQDIRKVAKEKESSQKSK